MNTPELITSISEAEEWRTVVGHPDYEVSSLGRVRVGNRMRPGGRWGGTQVIKGGLRLLSPNSQGYPATQMDGVSVLVHRAVLEAFIGPCPSGKLGAHWDGVKINNRLGNLRWATPQENSDDAMRHGTVSRGPDRPGAILDWPQVREIRGIGRSRYMKDIAAQYGVSIWTIFKILHNKMWREDEAA